MRNIKISSKSVKFYNMIFPVWILMIFPLTWIIVIPGNFIIDSLVLLLGMYFLKIENKKQLYMKTIIPIFLF